MSLEPPAEQILVAVINSPDDGGEKHLRNDGKLLPDTRRNIPENSHFEYETSVKFY